MSRSKYEARAAIRVLRGAQYDSTRRSEHTQRNAVLTSGKRACLGRRCTAVSALLPNCLVDVENAPTERLCNPLIFNVSRVDFNVEMPCRTLSALTARLVRHPPHMSED